MGWRQHAPIAVTIVLFSTAIGWATPSAGDAALFEKLDTDKNGQLVADEVPADQRRLLDRLMRRGDTNGDAMLSHDEFTAALVPSRPEKPIEEKEPATFPQANAVRWLLLTMDTNGNARIEQPEVPEDLQRIFTALSTPIDTNKNDVLETIELSRGGRPLARIAGRYVEQNDIDVAAALKRLEEKQGAAATRFEARPLRLDELGDPQKARQAFLQLDTNNDGQIETSEIPDPLMRQIQRLIRTADRDRDGMLSEREFVIATRRIAARAARQAAGEMPTPEAMPNGANSADER
jgi:Ca2+-binding EF-hand superfamily protein